MSATQQAMPRQLSPECLDRLRANAAKARAARQPRPDPSERPYPAGGAISADFKTVLEYAEPRHILCLSWDDLPRVNAIRDRAGLLPFKRAFPRKGRYG
jgi:hypothetical protein